MQGTVYDAFMSLSTKISCLMHFVFVCSENLTKLGNYTLHLQTLLSDGDSTTTEWAGRRLPDYTLNFSIKGNLEEPIPECVSVHLIQED